MTKAALKAAYGLLFCAVLPAGLTLWSARLDGILSLPQIEPEPIAWIGAIGALVLIAWAMRMLWIEGRGLPMNAFPPQRFVRRGPYALLEHPIYVGFSLLVVSVAWACGSSAGVLIVSPAVAVGCVALVLGYEWHDLNRRFGEARPRAWLRLPQAVSGSATGADRWRVAFIVLGAWLIAYEAIGHLPVPDAVELMRGDEANWPVTMWWVLVYSAAYPLPLIAIALTRSGQALHKWSRDAIFGMVLGFLVVLVVPVIATPRPFDPGSSLAWLMDLNRSDGVEGRMALPSFHVYWAFMAAALLAERGAAIGVAGWLVAIAIALSCAFTGMHAVVDIAAGAALSAIAVLRRCLWRITLVSAQRIANSWFEVRLGPLRILPHAFYAATAAGVGVALIGAFDPTVGPWLLTALAAGSLLGAGVWGRVLVGSRTLQRPFGYFGSVCGISVAAIAMACCGVDVWPLMAGVAAAAPWAQALGRLRCLIQGCCHGAPHDGGIRYELPQSRVAAVSGLRGVSVHATPVYSALANVVIGLLIARLCFIGAPASFVIGSYMFMQGAARFMEECVRGEVQTQQLAGLRVYQWCAIAIALVGIAVTCVDAPAAAAPEWPRTTTLWIAIGVAIAHALAMGVDAPDCRWPLSQLTPAPQAPGTPT